jgi:DNA-binding transcriptional MerR regulator
MSSSSRPRYYSIGQVAKMTGLPAYTIRYWEKEFRQLAPRKSRTGRRVFTEEDVAQVRQIQNLLHEHGFTIKGAREVLEKGEQALRPAPPVKPATPASQLPAQPAPGKSEREKLLEAKLVKMKQHIRDLIALLDKPSAS